MIRKLFFSTIFILIISLQGFSQSLYLGVAVDYVGDDAVKLLPNTNTEFENEGNLVNVGLEIPIAQKTSLDIEYFFTPEVWTSVQFYENNLPHSGFGTSITDSHNFSLLGVYHILNNESNWNLDVKGGIQVSYAIRTSSDDFYYKEHPLADEILEVEIFSKPGIKFHPKVGMEIGYSFFNRLRFFFQANYYQGFKSQSYQELTLKFRGGSGEILEHKISTQTRLYVGFGIAYDFMWL